MQISILGCGWLGFPLAKALILDGHRIHGSTTSESKMAPLADAGIIPFLIDLGGSEVGRTFEFLDNSDVLILNIPPKSREAQIGSFTSKIRNLIPLINRSGIRKVFFVSSTSVYADTNPIALANSLVYSASDAANEQLQAEKLLLAESGFATTIIRFGGLIGGERHPIKHLAGRKNIQNPEAPVNLIDRGDCIRVLSFLLNIDIETITMDAVFPNHPSREKYYTEKAKLLGLPLPEFDDGASAGKIVAPTKLLQLGFKFQYPI